MCMEYFIYHRLTKTNHPKFACHLFAEATAHAAGVAVNTKAVLACSLHIYINERE